MKITHTQRSAITVHPPNGSTVTRDTQGLTIIAHGSPDELRKVVRELIASLEAAIA